MSKTATYAGVHNIGSIKINEEKISGKPCLKFVFIDEDGGEFEVTAFCVDDFPQVTLEGTRVSARFHDATFRHTTVARFNDTPNTLTDHLDREWSRIPAGETFTCETFTSEGPNFDCSEPAAYRVDRADWSNEDHVPDFSCLACLRKFIADHEDKPRTAADIAPGFRYRIAAFGYLDERGEVDVIGVTSSDGFVSVEGFWGSEAAANIKTLDASRPVHLI